MQPILTTIRYLFWAINQNRHVELRASPWPREPLNSYIKTNDFIRVFVFDLSKVGGTIIMSPFY